jgi:hypothetical protein
LKRSMPTSPQQAKKIGACFTNWGGQSHDNPINKRHGSNSMSMV